MKIQKQQFIKHLFTWILVCCSLSLFAEIRIANTKHASTGLCDGQITVYSFGSAGPFDLSLYKKDDNNSWELVEEKGPSQGNTIFSNLCPGDYRIFVLNQFSCEKILEETIIECSEIIITDTPIIDSPQDCDSADGGFRFLGDHQPEGGTPPYSYLWSNGHTELTISNLSAGTYDLTITDTNGCTGTNSYTLEGETAPDVTLNTQEPSCENQSNGSIVISTFNNGDYTPYDFVWSNGKTTNNDIVSEIIDVPSGLYSVTISIPGGDCSFVHEFEVPTISADDPLELSGNTIDACSGNEDSGVIDLSVAGGVAPYEVVWSNGRTGFQVNGLSSGEEYCVTVTDYCGATITDCFEIGERPNYMEINGIASLACPPYESSTYQIQPGGITISVTGGTDPYRFKWDNGSFDQNLSNIEAGNYCVTVTDNYGCKKTDCFEVEAYNLNIALADFQNCDEGNCSDAFLDIELSGTAEEPYSVDWLPYNVNPTGEDLYDIPEAGVYTVLIEDDKHCRYNRSFTISDCEDAGEFSIENSVVVPASPVNDNNGVILLEISPPGNYSYSWTGPNGFVSSDKDIVGNGPGIYTVIISNGCGNEITETFEIEECSLDIELLDVDHACSSDGYATIDIRIENVSINDEFFLYSGPNGFVPLSVTNNNASLSARASFRSGIGEGCFVILNQDLCGGLVCTEIRDIGIEIEEETVYAFAYNPEIDMYVPYACMTQILCQNEPRDIRFESSMFVSAQPTQEGGCELTLSCGETFIGTYSGQVIEDHVEIVGDACQQGSYCFADVDFGLDKLVRLSAELNTEFLGAVQPSTIIRDGLCIEQRKCDGVVLEEIDKGISSETIACGREYGYGFMCVKLTGCGFSPPIVEPYPERPANLCCTPDLVYDYRFANNNGLSFSTTSVKNIIPGFVDIPKNNNQVPNEKDNFVYLDELDQRQHENSLISVYPNPFEDQIIIEFIGNDLYNTPIKARVLNNLGQVVESINFNCDKGKHQLDLPDFSPGIYYVHIQIHTGETWVEKIIKPGKP